TFCPMKMTAALCSSKATTPSTKPTAESVLVMLLRNLSECAISVLLNRAHMYVRVIPTAQKPAHARQGHLYERVIPATQKSAHTRQGHLYERVIPATQK